MTNDVVINNIINELCQKFNVASSELIPKMQAYGIAMSKLGMIISGVFVVLILIVLAIFVYVLYRRDKACGCVDHDTYLMCTIAFLIAELIPTGICIANAVNYVGWKYAPEIKAIEYVMNLIKK